MAIKAVGLVTRIGSNAGDVTKVDVTILPVGLVGGENVDFIVYGMDPGISGALWESALKTALKNHMISAYSYSFGLLDTVALVGAALL